MMFSGTFLPFLPCTVLRPKLWSLQGGLNALGFNMAALDYGCHCAAILSGQLAGLGQPVDALDSVCKDYLGCIRCVKKQTQCQKIDVSINGTFVASNIWPVFERVANLEDPAPHLAETIIVCWKVLLIKIESLSCSGRTFEVSTDHRKKIFSQKFQILRIWNNWHVHKVSISEFVHVRVKQNVRVKPRMFGQWLGP